MSKPEKKAVRAFFMISQIGISMMVPIALCVWLGIQMQKRLHSSIWLLLMIFLGIAAAFRNVFYLLRPFYAADKKKEDEELAYLENMKREAETNAQSRPKKEKQNGQKNAE